MKKRAQVPDAYTYTILLRGLAKHANYPKSLERALSIYHSMFNENSPCKPSTIHTNAVLNVCAHAKDLDALFGIAAKIPSRGMGAADNYTYTTILNAIRSVAWANTVELKDEGQGVKDAQRSEAVSKGRRIWIDIVDRWKRGHISMDEQLVCAMGRVLLLSNSIDDTDDILSLLEQTMRLPREVPRLGDPARGTHLRPVTSSDPTSAQAAGDGAEPQPLFENDENEQPINTESDLALVEEDSTSLTTVFNALPPVSNRIYAVPGRNALSLAIEACAQMKEFAAAQDYWGKLTRTVKPDAENYHVYLRLLRARRGGALAVDLLCAMLAPKREGGLGTGVVPKTFRLAMSTVVRDSLNRNSLQLATQIMTMMQGLLEEPDVRTGMMMLSLMNKDGHRFDPDYVKLALESLYALSRHLMSVSDYASSRNKSKSPPQDLDDTMEDEDIPETSTRQFLVKDSPKHTETTEMQEPEDAQHIDTTETTESEDKPPIAPPQRKLTERQLEILEFISAVVREHERSMYALYADSFTGRPNKRYKQQYMQLNAWILANDPRKSHAWERSRKDTRRAIGMKHLKWLDRKAVNSVAPLEAYEKSELRKAYE